MPKAGARWPPRRPRGQTADALGPIALVAQDDTALEPPQHDVGHAPGGREACTRDMRGTLARIIHELEPPLTPPSPLQGEGAVFRAPLPPRGRGPG